MMTTNKNQRTTHIDDVVKYQARPFFHSHCSLCDMRLFLQLFMHAFYIRRWKWWNYSHLHLHALSLLLSLTCFYISFHVFYHFSIIFVAQYKQFFIFSRHTLFYPIVPLVQNYVSRQKFKTYTRTKQKKTRMNLRWNASYAYEIWWNELKKMHEANMEDFHWQSHKNTERQCRILC